MLNYLQAIILSIVEGLTEFLPISSTGHLILTTDLMGVAHSEFVKSFEVIIQLGAILAVVVLYAKTLVTNHKLWPRIIVAFLPAAIIGYTFYNFIKIYLLGNVEVVLWALFLGGIILIIWEKYYQEQEHHLDKIEKLSLRKAFLVGVFQAFSVIPGVSRAGATILGGLIVGLKRKAAVELSFMLAIPTMIAATGLDLVKSSFNFTAQEWSILAVGFVGAFLTALLAVKYFLRYIQHHSFVAFGVYRIVLAVILWFVLVH